MKSYYLVYCRKSSEAEDRQMQSIQSQREALRELTANKDLSILKFFTEAKSAKAPGRPVFNQLIDKIYERDDIKGIVCWSINRLTRNPVDTGTLQWLLQQGDIDEIVTPTKTYTEVDSDFIMAIEGAQANRFIRDLRRDTLRGVKKKIEMGMAPLLALPGYKNNTYKKQGERDISPHPRYFSLMRQVFDAALTGNYTISDLYEMAKKLGVKNNLGREISLTQMHNCLKSPFYTGRFVYTNKIYQGNHKRMLTDEEFDSIQDILSGRFKPREYKHDFITGLVRCGECGGMITAEEHSKTLKNGQRKTYQYYRCTKKSGKCNQLYISAKDLENQMSQFLGEIKISNRFINWAIKQLNKVSDQEDRGRRTKQKAARKDFEAAAEKLSNLIQLKISPMNKDGLLLSDEEFAEEKRILTNEKGLAQERLKQISERQDNWAERAGKVFDFAAKAQERFENSDIEIKKQIMRSFGSNLILKNRILEVEPRGPFKAIRKAVKAERQWLETIEKVDKPSQSELLYLQNSVWGG